MRADVTTDAPLAVTAERAPRAVGGQMLQPMREAPKSLQRRVDMGVGLFPARVCVVPARRIRQGPKSQNKGKEDA